MKEKLRSFRLPLKIDKEIEIMASLEDSDKSKLMRELIILGLKEKKIKESVKLYSEGKITLWKAATLSDVSLWKMLEIIKEKKVSLQYGERELAEDFKAMIE